MMTKKDFKAIAHCLNANVAPVHLVQDFADMLEEDNPRFDRALFVQASTIILGAELSHQARILDKARKGQA